MSETLGRRVIPGLVVVSIALATPSFLHGAAPFEPTLGKSRSPASPVLANPISSDATKATGQQPVRLASAIITAPERASISDKEILGLQGLDAALAVPRVEPVEVGLAASAPTPPAPVPIESELTVSALPAVESGPLASAVTKADTVTEALSPSANEPLVLEPGNGLIDPDTALEPVDLAIVTPAIPKVAPGAAERIEDIARPEVVEAAPLMVPVEPTPPDASATVYLEVSEALPEPIDNAFFEPLDLPEPPGLGAGIQASSDLMPVASAALAEPKPAPAPVESPVGLEAAAPKALALVAAPRAPTVSQTTATPPNGLIDRAAKLAPPPLDAGPKQERDEAAFVPTLKGNSLTSRQALVGNGSIALDITSQLTARIDGRAAGTIEFKQSLQSISVKLGSLMAFLKDRYDVAEFERLAQSSAKDTYLSLAQLREAGIPISYDPVYDEFNIGSTDYRPEAAHKVQIEQIGKPERGVEPIRIDQITQ